MSATRPALIAGFEPFGGDTVNPAALIADRLNGARIASRQVVGLVLPCRFGASMTLLSRAIETVDPEVVIAVGLANGRFGVSLERVAINVDDARIPDNAGLCPIDEPIVPGGPAAYFSTLPIKRIVQVLHAERIPADISQTAGTFVCNHVFYGLMHALRETDRVRAGFVHVPCLPEQAARSRDGTPSMPLAVQVRALEHALQTAIEAPADIKSRGGATH